MAARPKPWFADARLDGTEFGTAGLLMAPGHRALLLTQQSSDRRPGGHPGQALPAVDPRRAARHHAHAVDQPARRPAGRLRHRPLGADLRRQRRSLQPARRAVPEGEEVERFPELPLTGDNGSEIPFDTPSSATFSGRRVLVANQSFTGDTSHHAILDVYVGERGAPSGSPAAAGRP